MRIPGLRLIAIAAVLASSLLVIACGGEDRPSVDVIEDSGPGSGTGSASASGGPAEPGVVEAKPEGATEVDVTLREWEVSANQTTVQAGPIYFLVNNVGPEDTHEFVVIRTDVDADELALVDGRVPEDDVDIVDEIEPFTAGSSASITLDLEPGHYALICNIAEVEDGELESHYQLGMRRDFTVE